MAYWQLFFSSFNASLVFLPWLKDFALTTMLLNGGYDKQLIYLVAVLATLSASAVNYFLGRFFKIINIFYRLKLQNSTKKPLRSKVFGYLLLPISCFSIIGEAISLLAGWLKLNFIGFLLIITIARLLFYYLIIFQNIDIDFLEKF